MKKLRTAAVIYTLFVLCFIWCHSAMPRSLSKAESEGVGALLTPFLEFFVGEGNVTDYLVRKLAHFVEYAALGFGLFYSNLPAGKKTSENTSAQQAVRDKDVCCGLETPEIAGRVLKDLPVWKRIISRSALCAFIAAFFDETIQIFSGRGPMIADVWLDFAGATAGIMIAAGIMLILRSKIKL